MPAANLWTRLLPWVARGAWIAVGATGTSTLESALEERSTAVRLTALILAGLLWLAGVAAVAVAATTTVTLARVAIPVALPAGLVLLFAGADSTAGVAMLLCALLAALAVITPDYGQIAVQSSAYGNEWRFPLRAPIGYLLAAVMAWVLWVAAGLSGPLLLAAQQWVPGLALTALAVAMTWLGIPRWHRLARRWLVFVPAGVVVHDPVLLTDTVMVKRSQVRSIVLAPADTEAFDLTGPTSGHAVEIALNESITVVCAPVGRAAPRAVHLTAMLVAPSRPGRALTAARDRALLSR